MRPFTSSLLAARNLLANRKRMLWFVELERRGGGMFRLVEAGRVVTANGKKWQPTKLMVSVPAESQEGAIGEMTVTLPNVARVAIAELEARSIQGQALRIWAEHEDDFEAFAGVLYWEARVLKAAATQSAVRLTAGHPATLQRLPRGVFDGHTSPLFTTTSGGAL